MEAKDIRNDKVWAAVDKDGTEIIFQNKPIKKEGTDVWILSSISWDEQFVELPKGTIKKIIGRDLTWEDEPVMIK